MERKIGIGIVGAGTTANWHAEGVREHAGSQVVSVFSLHLERARQAQERWQAAKVASSLEELVSDDAVDAVIVATPPEAHAEPTIAALEAGKHVLCEKPLALDAAEAAAMVEAAERSGAFLACASSRRRLRPAYQAARAMIDRGELGDVYHVHARLWRLRGRPGHDFGADMAWSSDQSITGQGVIMDVGVYGIDAVLWMLGHPRVVSVTAQTRCFAKELAPKGELQNLEDDGLVLLHCEGGKSALVETSWATNMTPQESFIVLGTKAGLRLDPLTKISARRVGMDTGGPFQDDVAYEPVEERPYPELPPPSLHDPIQATRRFLDDVAAGVQPPTSGQESLQIMEVIDAAYRSAQAGTSVALEEAGLDGSVRRSAQI